MSAVDRLDVYLHSRVAGVLERRSQARLRFAYAPDWIESDEQPLSLSLPVRSEPFEHEECAPFFEGLLPEGDFLKAIARTLHVSATNPFQLLTELGGECAGAISVAPAGGPEPGQDPRPPRWLSEKELGALLRELPQRPLIAVIDEAEDGGGFRLSLAGAQDKVGVLVENGKIGLSHGRPPTTAILKPPIPRVEESVANEAFCMTLAAHVDLEVAAAAPRLADSQEYLLVHRYDRGGEAADGRIHQEDFCQALGLVPAVKYEREGGPTIADCAGLIRRNFRAPARDLTAFLDAIFFNFLIANHDAHSKNYSLLLDGPEAVRLAPLYDLISTAVYPGTDRKLAMRYGGEKRPEYLRGRHLDRLAHDLGVKPTLVRRRALSMCERIEAAAEEARGALTEAFQDHPVIEKVIAVVAERSDLLRRRAGEEGGSVGSAVPEHLGEFTTEMEGAMAQIAEGFNGFSGDLEAFVRVVQGSAGIPVAEALDKPARSLKVHGRAIYDGVVDFEAYLENVLGDIEAADSGAKGELLDLLAELSENARDGIENLEVMYQQVSVLEEAAPAFRTPLRSMRAGMRDLLEARTIISEWNERAERIAGRSS
jgi:serine/threonine-protein kinase HipA